MPKHDIDGGLQQIVAWSNGDAFALFCRAVILLPCFPTTSSATSCCLCQLIHTCSDIILPQVYELASAGATMIQKKQQTALLASSHVLYGL